MKIIKVYTTRESRYSTIGRKNIRISCQMKDSGELDPKYGKALRLLEAKKELTKCFNN